MLQNINANLISNSHLDGILLKRRNKIIILTRAYEMCTFQKNRILWIFIEKKKKILRCVELTIKK